MWQCCWYDFVVTLNIFLVWLYQVLWYFVAVNRWNEKQTLISLYRNIFPENLVQACFQHTKTVYTKSVAMAKDIPDNITDIINITLAATTHSSILTTITVNSTDGTNVTLVLAKEHEIKWVRELPMADGINVLGEHYVSKSIKYFLT